MPQGLVVNPDLTTRTVNTTIADAAALLGGTEHDSLHVAFVDSGRTIAALYCSAGLREDALQPNPLASMGRNEADTGNARFFTDPSRAILGPVLFLGDEGRDLSAEDLENINRGIRAVENYRADEPEEFRLWHDAVINVRRQHAESATDASAQRQASNPNLRVVKGGLTTDASNATAAADATDTTEGGEER